jgi:DNA (cytosine-5)-methyltransferase 1
MGALMCYYNDHEPFACQWLRNLITAGHLPVGTVDERDIRRVQPDEVRSFVHCHFFAGIGGWPLALALAGWDAARPVWTASCPCQPFSTAGLQKGEADERHLWPALFALVRECQPDCLLGEQVGGAAGYEWLDGIRTDLESQGYAFAAADLPAAGVGAPHIRQRLFWGAVRLADADSGGCGRAGAHLLPGPARSTVSDSGRTSSASGLGNANQVRLQGHGAACGKDSGRGSPREETGPTGSAGVPGFWSAFDLIPCRDGKVRRAEPGSFPLAHGVSSSMGPLLARLGELGHDAKTARRLVRESSRNRVGRLKGYGNAIVPEVAAVFVRAFMDAVSLLPCT